MITSGNKKFVAKFSSQNDLYGVVKAEYIAMRLAAEVGLTVASVSLERAAGKDVLLIERFDRVKVEGGWRRKAMVSALTLLELDELMARYASYEQLATIIRHRFQAPEGDAQRALCTNAVRTFSAEIPMTTRAIMPPCGTARNCP